MAIALDIFQQSFNKTKKLFFPIRSHYWLKMGLVSLLMAGSFGGSGFNFSGSDFGLSGSGDFTSSLAEFNSQALNFLSEYSLFIGIGIVSVTVLTLILMYIQSIFTFVFIDGVVSGDIAIGESYRKQHDTGMSYFLFRLIFGLIGLVVFGLLTMSVWTSFLSNSLVNFNLSILFPMVGGIVICGIVFGVFSFVINNFVVPIMYLKGVSIKPAFDHFMKIGKGKISEMVIYWLATLVLSFAAGIGSLIVILLFMAVCALFMIPLAMVFGMTAISSPLSAVVWVVLGVFLAVPLGLLFAYSISVILVPIPSFFKMYSLDMIRAFEKGHESKKLVSKKLVARKQGTKNVVSKKRK